MAAGGQAPQVLNTGALDGQISAKVQAVASALEECFDFYTWMVGPGGGLSGLQAIAAGGGRATQYSVAEATDIFNSFTDLRDLRNVSHSAGTVLVVKDFFVNARKIGPTNMP